MLKALFVSMVCAAAGFAQNSNSVSASGFLWAKAASGTGKDMVLSMAVDSSGNCYAAGRFGWDPGAVVSFGTLSWTNRGGDDAFLIKYDPSGTLLWARRYGGSGHDDIRQVTFDQAGNVLIAGQFANTVDFGSTNVAAAGEDMFLAKISSEGDCIWVVKGGGERGDFAEDICVDGEGSCYVAGYIRSTNAVFGQLALKVRSTNSNGDPFIAKYNGAGEIQWIQQVSSPDYGYGIHVAANPIAGVYVTGSFYGVGTFGPTNLTSTAKLFLASFAADGSLRWVNEAGGDDTFNDGSYGTGVVAETNGNVYLTGFFSNPAARFDGLWITNSAMDGWTSDVFLAKYDEHGTVQWVTSAGGTRGDAASSLAVDSSGDVYIAGNFSSVVANFAGILVTNTMSDHSWPWSDGVLARYKSNGDVVSVQRFGGSEDDHLISTAFDGVGNLFVGGIYRSWDMPFGLPPSSGGYDGFLAKFETGVAPRLAVRSTGPSTAELWWSALAERFYLESAPSFQSPMNWQSNAVSVERIGTTNRVLIDTAMQHRLYRLKRDAR